MAGFTYSKSSGLNDSIYGKTEVPIKKTMKDKLEAFEKKSHISNIFNMEKSNNFAEKYIQETSLGDFKDVGENGARPVSGYQEGFSKVIEPHTWKNSFEVTKEMVEDAKYGRIKQRTVAFTESYGRTREKFAASMLAGGMGATMTFGGKAYDTTTGDGLSLFNTAHKSKTKSKYTQSNCFSGTLSIATFDAMQERMQDFADDDGNVLSVSPDTIIIPNSAALKRDLYAIVGSELDPESSDNAINFQVGLWNILVWPYLPKTIGGQPYFIMMDKGWNKSYDGLIWVDRVPLAVRSYVDDNTDANVWSGRARFGAGFNDWRSIAICGAGTGGTALS